MTYRLHPLGYLCRAVCDVWSGKDVVTEVPDSDGSSSAIIIVLVVVLLLVAAGVTVFAQKKKILCFKPSPGSDEATGTSPLLKDTAAASKTSPSRATSASGTTLDKSRPSRTTVSGH